MNGHKAETPYLPRPRLHSCHSTLPRTAANSRQRKEIKCTSFMRELGSYFHPPPHTPSLPGYCPALLPSLSLPLSVPFLCFLSAHNALIMEVHFWHKRWRCGDNAPPVTPPPPLSLCCCCCSLFSLLHPFPHPAWQHLDWFIAHSLQRRLVQSALAKWSEGGKAEKRECRREGRQGNLPHEWD